VAKVEAVETLTNRKLGKIDAPTTAKGGMLATNSNTPMAQAKMVS